MSGGPRSIGGGRGRAPRRCHDTRRRPCAARLRSARCRSSGGRGGARPPSSRAARRRALDPGGARAALPDPGRDLLGARGDRLRPPGRRQRPGSARHYGARSDRADGDRAHERALSLVPEQHPRRSRARTRRLRRSADGRPARLLGRARDALRPAVERARHRLVDRQRADRDRDWHRGRIGARDRDRHPRRGALACAALRGPARRLRPTRNLVRRRSGGLHGPALRALQPDRTSRLAGRRRTGRGRGDRLRDQPRGRRPLLAARCGCAPAQEPRRGIRAGSRLRRGHCAAADRRSRIAGFGTRGAVRRRRPGPRRRGVQAVPHRALRRRLQRRGCGGTGRRGDARPPYGLRAHRAMAHDRRLGTPRALRREPRAGARRIAFVVRRAGRRARRAQTGAGATRPRRRR